MARKLKVFRMAVGFEDAYVAAPSRKAALAAWGSEHDQFARGVAEEITDPALTKEPLAHPGEVIRKSRGDLAAQLKAKPPKRKRAGKGEAPEPADQPQASAPPPKRTKLDKLDAAVEAAEQRHRAETARLEDQRAAIDAKLDALRERQDRELRKLIAKRDEAEEAYRAALAAWSE